MSQQLPAVEIQGYWGENFSSGLDLRGNTLMRSEWIEPARYNLVVNGLVAKPVRYSYKKLLEFPGYEKRVILHCVEGWSAQFLCEGLLVNDLLKAAEVSPRAKRAVFYGADGYTTSLPLDFIRNKKIMMAYKMNGLPLTVERGSPLHLVAEKKWGSKWVKSITRIELSDSKQCNGYRGSLCDSKQ